MAKHINSNISTINIVLFNSNLKYIEAAHNYLQLIMSCLNDKYNEI